MALTPHNIVRFPAPALRSAGAIEIIPPITFKYLDSVRVHAASGTLSAIDAGSVVSGVTLALGDSFLYQPVTAGIASPGPTNGIYVANADGVAPTRRSDADTGSELQSAAVLITEGTAAGQSWICINDPAPVVGTDPITFRLFQSGGGTLSNVDNFPTATQPQAEAGTSNAAFMTPLRTNQEIVALGQTGLYDPGVTGFSGPFGTLRDAVQVTLYATHLGMAGDDATDNSAKLTQALAVLSSMGGGRFVFDYDRSAPGICIYRLGSPHVIPSHVEIEGQDGVGIRINHNSGVGLDFTGTAIDQTQHQVLRRLRIYDGGTRNGTYKLIRFQQSARFVIDDCFFNATRDSLHWNETQSGRIVNTIFWECTGIDWAVWNSIDIWIYGVHILGNKTPAGVSAIGLGSGIEFTNGVSGVKAFGLAIGRKQRGLYFGTRSGATGRTPEHVDMYGLVIDNCRDVGIEIEDLFNANFNGYFVSYCGNIDATLGDPNGERRVGILMSAGDHPDVSTVASTQTVRFHRGGWVAMTRREGLVIQGTVASGRTKTPTDIGIHGEFGSNNNAVTAGVGHILVDGGDVHGLNFDGVTFKAADIKITLATPRADQCIKFNGTAANEHIRLTNMTLGDTNGVIRMVGNISTNAGVVIAGNNELFFTTWTPVLNFGGSAAGVTGTLVGRTRRGNGMMMLEFEITLTNNGSGTGAATITGVPETSIGDAVGDLRILSGGAAIPTGVHCRINGATIHLDYQAATGRAALDDTHLTNTVNFVGSVSYAMGAP